jgi:hypothetical protein
MILSRHNAASTAAFVAILVACLLAAIPSQAAVAGTGEGIAFMKQHQMPDGGFTEPGRSAGADATTAWCVMALRAAGIDPNSVRVNGNSPLDFLARQSSSWRSVTDYERTLLAAAAAGEDLRSFGGVDLVAKVQSYQRSGGNIGDAINSNAFGIFAYKAAGLAVPPGAVDWHVRNQNGDGGWGNSPGAASNPDMTAASIMALRAGGVSIADASVQSALGYLRSIQNDDGGFSFEPGSSDVSATAWCVQAIVAAGQDPAGADWARSGHTPRGFVASMQASDGRFYWMEGTDKNPVWTTAYAVCALAGKPYPIGITYSGTPSGQGGGGSEDAVGGGPAPGGPSQEGEAPGDGGEEMEGQETQGGESPQEPDAMAAAEEENKDEASAASTARAAGDNGADGSTGGTSFLVWLIPLLVAVPLLSLGGWRLYRRYN